MGSRSVIGLWGAVSAATFTTAFTTPAHAFQGEVNGLGQGQARGSIWVFPNSPPATANFTANNTQAPVLTMGPGIPGADPRTGLFFQGGQNWRTSATVRAAHGDSADWHSMLPHVTPTNEDASGFLEVFSAEPFGGNARLFTVQWGASDPGVAFHIGWFSPQGDEIFETPVMVGPFNRTDTFLVQASFPIELLRMEVSGAAVSRIPAPGVLGLLAGAGLVAMRRRR